MKNRILLIALAILSIGILVTVTGRAQEGSPEEQPVPNQEQSQAPASVGRLSVVRGQVSTMHGDDTTWHVATVNTPIVLGDKLSTGDRARAELQLDPANIIRLDQHTEAQVADFQPGKINIQLASGLVNFSVAQGTQADVEVDTPNMGVHPLSPGVYRIQVNSDTETMLIVHEGEAEVLTNDGSTKVEAGQMIQIHGSDHPEYKVESATGGDDFDRWCSDRDRESVHAQVERPPQAEQDDPDYVGSNDLNAYGQWSEVPDQGWCWTPQVDAGWVPYTYGHWGYEPYFGWTWISLEPWGWAPYHYGSWFSYGGRWHWRPDHGGGHFGDRGNFYGGRRYGNLGGARFNPRGSMNGRPGGNLPAWAAHTTFSGSPGRANFGASSWNGYSRGNQFGRGPTTRFGANGGFQRTAPGSRGGFQNNNWQRYASPSPYGSGRQGFQPRTNYGGGYGGSRPPLELNRPIMRQRAPSGGGYSTGYGGGYGSGRTWATPNGPNGGGRTYSPPSGSNGRGGYSTPANRGAAPSGGNRNYSAPSGGNRGYSAPSGRGGGNFGGGGGGGARGSGGGASHGGGGGGGSHGGGGHR